MSKERTAGVSTRRIARSAVATRSKQRDATATRAALLSTAISEFAAKGYSGARVDEIANRAGVNKQLLYHYFGNKDDLYRIALETVYSEIREKEQGLDLGNLSPVEAMRALVGYSFDYLFEHPEFIKLVNDENAQGARHAAQSDELAEMHWPLVELLRETLERGAAEGVLRDDMDPINVYISIAAISYFYFSNNPTLSAIFGKQLNAPQEIASRRQHVVDFALSALMKTS